MRAIRDAALDVFSQKGFAAARLDDVAAAAGVAKGTIYLYFASKEDLLEAIVKSSIGAVIAGFEEKIAASALPASEMLRMMGSVIVTAFGDQDRRRVLHLVMCEGGRFPQIAEFYHREIISRGMRLIRAIVAKGCESGEFVSDELARFPQLVLAPALVAVVWGIVFQRVEPLDARAMVEAHFDLLSRALTRRPS